MKRKEKHTFYNFQFKHTAVTITNHPNIESIDIAEALNIHPILLYRWRQEMRAIKGSDYLKSKRKHIMTCVLQKLMRIMDKKRL